MYRELLAREGVECLLKNDQLFSAIGEIPFVECYPELWVVDDEVYPRAQLLLDGWLRQSLSNKQGWRCPDCGELCDPQFEQCWNCLSPRD
ncbi:Putative signal transducing protein [Malonomonas rubra DSM 5091]|uniref:Putative signal transducing protein n=1 Tax=Malonomonas rubra DSM 5091 TaxID=1122189 RepID=A0A1M6CGW2_MALRU|nr:DUF2007 domain-containing protein [Malonomonas rubra]SHI59928.1 Putative signal transducing protein [Malonomonas rubra DSM 5091]